MGKIGCIAIVKNEQNHIVEWLAWQFCAGFDAVLLLDNASTDSTAAIARGFASRFDVRVQSWPSTSPDYQCRAYEHAARQLADEFEWLAFFDTDEFLMLDDGLTLKSLLDARPEPAIVVNWAIFGSSGHAQAPAGFVTTSFVNRSRPGFPPNRHFKSIIRPQHMRACLNPHVFNCGADPVDLLGRPIVQEQPGVLAAEPDYACGKLHHYFTRSHAQFQAKLARGYPDVTRSLDDFATYDRNELFDDSAGRQSGPLARILSEAGAPKQNTCAIARGPSAHPVRDLIFDIGMSEGNDTAFYLAKGFRVVGVEPDVEMFYALQERFAEPIANGQLVLLNLAAGARHGEIVEFFHHAQAQGISGLSNARAEFATGYKSYHVMTIDWAALTEKHGVPHYAKIDIEGNEVAFLSGAVSKFPLPSFISVECQNLAPARALHALGYSLFKLIDQNPPGGFHLPEHQPEGRAVSWPQFSHASGPFGQELPGEWVDFDALQSLWQAAEPNFHRTWFDCHAWMP